MKVDRTPSRISTLLATLYGPQRSREAAGSLEQLIARHRSVRTPGSPRGAVGLTQGDALLITYADQVCELDRVPLQTLAAFIEDHLTGVVSGVHLLPFFPSSSDDGFAVKDYLAVDAAYGVWDDIARLGQRFDLMFDAVFNHASAQGEWFGRFLRDEPEFHDFFVTVEGNHDFSRVVRPRALPLLTEFAAVSGPRKIWTTFSADQVDLNFKNPAVLLRALETLLFYIAKGARFIRLDAIAFLWKEIGTTCLHLPQTHCVVQLMRAVLDEVAPGVLLITETNVPHADNVSYFGDGTNEAQLIYNFALPPLVLHVLAAGNAGKLTRWAQSLALPSERVTFFNFLASHDGIGLNPARGILGDHEIDALVARTLDHGGFVSYKNMSDGSQVPYELNINYLDALSNPAAGEPVELAARKFLTAQAIMLSLQGMPGIYFHSLFGSRGDRAGVEASGIKRRINREKLDRARLEADLADAGLLRARVFDGYCELLRARASHAAFAPDAAQHVLDLDARVFAVLRASADGADRVLCLHNASPDRVCVRPVALSAGPVELPPYGSRWIPVPA